MKKRFVPKYKQSGFSVAHSVFVDRETGINYLYVGSAWGGGLTPLLDKEGKPIITKEDIE